MQHYYIENFEIINWDLLTRNLLFIINNKYWSQWQPKQNKERVNIG